MEKVLVVEWDVLHEDLKIAHTYTFLTKNFYGFETVFVLWFWDFSRILYAYYVERKFCHKYTHALSPVWNRPLYMRIIYERNFAQIYMRIAVRLEFVGDWLSVGILAFVCITFCICGHRLKKVVFFDWLMSKLVVKMW